MPLLPVALYGLEVPCGDVLIPAVPDFPATFRITMAAIDPGEDVEEAEKSARPRATLKIVRQPMGDDDDDDSEEYMRALLADSDSDDDDEEDEEEEEANGGPSDPSKTRKARKAAALQQLMETLGAGSDDEMEDAPAAKKEGKKGKAKANDDEEAEEDDEDDEEDDDEEIEVEEFVLCTLDPEKNYQQALDITIAENERVFFKVSGTHTIYLTGNYVIPDDNGHNHHHEVYDSEDDEDDEDYDLSPDEDELEIEMDGEESDDLDDLEEPRITEIDSEEEAPKLVTKKEDKKGKNKRSADEIEEATSLDDIMAKSLKPESGEEPKLSKKQLKKLKKNNGDAAPAKTEDSNKEEAKDVTPAKGDKGDKKVQFAKNLEQGPTGSTEKTKAPAADTKPSVKTVSGVKIEDKKVGTGAPCKKGQKVGMRYIGKLTDGKVFDSNKKGAPFTFKLGTGEVIKGWDIGIAGMCVGGERRITVPASLGYGSKSMPGIPANSTLIFDVKMLSIK